MRQRFRIVLGVAAALAVLSAVTVPTALGATGTWEFEPSVYDFGLVALGSHLTHQFSLTNVGETSIEGSRNWRLRSNSGEPELFKVVADNCDRLLEPGESCSIGVSFNPTGIGHREGELEVGAKYGSANTATLAFEGHSDGALATIKPAHLEFGADEAGWVSEPQTLTLENSGDLGLSIGSMSFTDLSGVPEQASQFRIVGGTCKAGETVASSGGICTIDVALAPSHGGSFASRLAIADNAFGSPQLVELKGVGTPGPPGPPKESSIRVTHHPDANTKQRAAAFRFIAVPAGARTECQLDHDGFKPCSSPQRYPRLALGGHHFTVRVLPFSNEYLSAGAAFHWQVHPRRH